MIRFFFPAIHCAAAAAAAWIHPEYVYIYIYTPSSSSSSVSPEEMDGRSIFAVLDDTVTSVDPTEGGRLAHPQLYPTLWHQTRLRLYFFLLLSLLFGFPRGLKDVSLS